MKQLLKYFSVVIIIIPRLLIGQITDYAFGGDLVENNLNKKSYPSVVSSVPLISSSPLKIVVLIIDIKGNPGTTDDWPVLENPPEYPNEFHPLLGTFPDGTLLREYIDSKPEKSIPIDEWYEPQIEQYFNLNSNGKFPVNVIFPKTRLNKIIQTKTTYSEFVEINLGSTIGMVVRYSNWKKMAEEALEYVYTHSPGLLKNTKYLSLIYQVSPEEYTEDSYTAFSPDIKFDFRSSTGERLYNGYVSTTYSIATTLHEIFHRIGSMAGEPQGFEGLPDRTTINFLNLPNNMTWGHDLMCNKGPIPSENALYGVPPMLTMDRIFLGWIEPDEVLTVNHTPPKKIKLRDVNIPLSDGEKAEGFYRAAKVMIHSSFDGKHDEYFLLEYHAGTNFDRNFYNIFEKDVHKGILIWHIKERVKILNRSRSDDNHIDLEIAVPYNGWNGNPVPDDDFPRSYDRPSSWYTNVNAAGDFDYFDDKAGPPYMPDGGVHRWEMSDTTNPLWEPYFLRRNTLRSNFFTDEEINGIVTNKMTNDTRPSTKDWEGNKTNIALYNIKRVDDYMTLDVSYSGAALGVDDNESDVSEFRLIGNYPNPFNPSTTIIFNVAEKAFVQLQVFDSKGELVETLVNGDLDKGMHSVVFDVVNTGKGYRPASGVYFYRLSANNFKMTKKMLLLK